LSEPTPTELVIRVLGCAVSARDLAAPPGRVAGGAVIGEVVRTGAEAAELAGAIVLVPPWLACFECDLCRRGRGVVCPRGGELGIDRDGGFGAEVVVPARPVLPLSGALALGERAAWPLAALARHGALAYATYARLGVGPGDTVVVRGLGGVGLLLCEILLAKGVGVIAVDGDAAARARAPAGVKRAVSPEEELPAAELGAVARVVDTSGSPAGIAAALATLPVAGTLALVDPGRAGAALVDVGALAARDQTVFGVAGCHADLYPELVALALRGDLALEALTCAVPRAEAPALLAALRAGRSPAPIPILV